MVPEQCDREVISWQKYFKVHLTIGLGEDYVLKGGKEGEKRNLIGNFSRFLNPISGSVFVVSVSVSAGYFCNGNLMIWLSKLFFYDCQVS